ncbi:MAG: helix-turn-helix domain-containing protein [Lachnospiraceae bacterium]
MENEKKIPLSELRKAKGFSQKEFAVELGVSSALIALYEVGKRKPKLERAIMIAKYFNVPVENILFARREDANKELICRDELKKTAIEQQQNKQMTVFDL